ncbi:MAG: pitrilysin family protein [Alphaproteobacteria bacterium]
MRTAVLFLLLLLPFGFGSARAEIFNPETATLENGLQIIVVTNRRAPVVSHMVWYRVGSMDEPPGKTGIAHFFEHLMFKSTDMLDSGEFSALVAENGGEDNAFTSYDYTGYYQNIAADRLGLVMKMESNRMRNLRLDPDEIETERNVVLEERRSRTDNNPSARLREQSNAVFYLNHPYRNPIIGWEHEIRALTKADLLAFYKLWYAPNNATLVVVGDVTMADVLPLAEKYYGPIKPSDLPERPDWKEPHHEIVREVELRDPQVRQPSWSERYLAPSYSTADDMKKVYALEVASAILGDGSTSKIYSSLVVDQQIATSAGVWYDPSARGPTTFGFYVSPVQDKSLDEAVAALQAEVARIVETGITQEEVDRAIVRLTDAAEFAKDSFSGIARLLGSAVTIGLSIEEFEAWPDRIRDVTAEDVNKALADVMTANAPFRSRLLPADAPEGDRS